MTLDLSAQTSANQLTGKVMIVALASIISGIFLLCPLGLATGVTDSTGFNNVQVFVQTSQVLPYSYTVTAYNDSGYQVAYYQSNYSAAAFELPSGTYLFTAQATYGATNYPCIGCVSIPIIFANSTNATTSATMIARQARLLAANGSGSILPENTTAVTNSTTGGNTVVSPIVPIFRIASSSEYGYAIEQISGPTTVNIDTYNATSFPTTQLKVHVSYFNGTAAEGAWVYASVVDDYSFNGSGLVSGVQTGAGGDAVLTVPQAPLLVTSYLNANITLPQSQSNYTTIVGGQEVNVTVYWEPTSINLEGQALVLPPQTDCSITLRYQPQQYYYPLPQGVTSALGITGAQTNRTVTTTMTATAVNQNLAQERAIPPFSSSEGVKAGVPTKSSSVDTMLLIGGGVSALAAIVIIALAVHRRNEQSIVSA